MTKIEEWRSVAEGILAANAEPMTAEEVIGWRESLGYSQRQAAGALGVGRRTIQQYEAGAGAAVPRYFTLACLAVSMLRADRPEPSVWGRWRAEVISPVG